MRTVFPFRTVTAVLLFLFFLIHPLFAGDSDTLPETKKSYFIQINSLPSDPDVFLLSCSVVEQSSSIHSSFSNTTRLPVLPLRLGKWEESCYVLPGMNPGFRKRKLQDGVTFRFPETGISRKAMLKKSDAGSYRLTLFWFEGKIVKGAYQFIQIFTIVELSGSKPVQVWPHEEKQP